MRVAVDVEEVELTNDEGRPVPGLRAVCRRCDEEVTCFGTSARSARRCMVLLKEECPMGEDNYYAAPEAEE